MAPPKISLKLYNTLTRSVDPLEPIEPGHVRMYNCGPTVYNHAHIGNMCAYMLADLLRRACEYAGLRVTQVVNITDVGHMTVDGVADASGEDKLEAQARRERKTPWDVARTYTQRYFADLDTLNIKAAHYYPRATEFVPEMITIVERLLAKGLAYTVASGDVYFDVTAFPGYGKLSGNTLEKCEAGARVEVRSEKRHPGDFALWKRDPKHIMQWPSPWGEGFPGWHIECSAMSQRFLGDTFDIHTGGEDNIFPHHECEIAQSEGANGKPFVKHWLHTRFLLVEGKKMSKSAGNFFTVPDLLARGFTGREIRYALISTHYRTQQNFTIAGLEAARKNLERIDNFTEKLEREATSIMGSAGERNDTTSRADLGFLHEAGNRYDEALANDLNVSGALGALFDLVREGNKRSLSPLEAAGVLSWLREADDVLGVIFFRPRPEARPADPSAASTRAGTASATISARIGDVDVTAEEANLFAERNAARAGKKFDEADRVRKLLEERGLLVTDTPAGPRLKRK